MLREQISKEEKTRKDDDQKNEEVNISGINDKNLIEDKIQKIDQEIKINDSDNGNNITNTNDINVENNAKIRLRLKK